MRDSTEVKVRSVADVVTRAVVGLILLAGGGFFLYLEETNPPSHPLHVGIFAAVAIFGAFLLKPDSMFIVLNKIVVIVGPYIPVIGGRRAGDPPSEPKP